VPLGRHLGDDDASGRFVGRGQIGEGAADVDPDDDMREMIASGKRREARPMATSGEAIRHLWTHKTQDHPWLADEELVIERAEGVWVWTERGKKLLDGFAGLAVVNVGHGRRRSPRPSPSRPCVWPITRRSGSSRTGRAELAAKLAGLTPGDLDYSVSSPLSGAEANERAMQMARHFWLA